MARRIIYDPILGKLRKADITSGEIAELRQLIAAKADKVTGATAGNIAILTTNGNLADGGARTQFATAAQGSKADTALQPSDVASLTTADIDDVFPTIIQFAISSATDDDDRIYFNAVEDWCWEEFINSEYNTDHIFRYDIESDCVTYDSNMLVKVYGDRWKEVTLETVVQDNVWYKLFSKE